MKNVHQLFSPLYYICMYCVQWHIYKSGFRVQPPPPEQKKNYLKYATDCV